MRRGGGSRDRVRGFSWRSRRNLLRRLASINRGAFRDFRGRMKWKQATSYVKRYMAKPEEFHEGLQTGRIWGIWNEEYLPVRWKTVEVSLRDAFRIRRTYRKLARRKGIGSLRRITVFVRHENVVRLLRLLGYQLA
jgi:hypothetical protein